MLHARCYVPAPLTVFTWVDSTVVCSLGDSLIVTGDSATAWCVCLAAALAQAYSSNYLAKSGGTSAENKTWFKVMSGVITATVCVNL